MLGQHLGHTTVHLGILVNENVPNLLGEPQSLIDSTFILHHETLSIIITYSSMASQERGTRVTPDLIIFFGKQSPLSNHHHGVPFSGQVALDLLLPRLLDLRIPAPLHGLFSTHILAEQTFSTSEQWMMACKAWLFEATTFDLGIRDSMTFWNSQREKTKRRLLDPSTLPSKESTKDSEVAFYNSCFMRILRETNPVKQKHIGRTIPNFNQSMWDRASMEIVTAGLVARAEADSSLSAFYVDIRKLESISWRPILAIGPGELG